MDTVVDSQPVEGTLRRLFESDSIQAQLPSAAVLGLNGKEAHREILGFLGSALPIVVLSETSEAEDEVILLHLGASSKPLSPKELLARVRSAIRRTGTPQKVISQTAPKAPNHEVLMFGDARVDFTSMEATRAGKPVTLTAQEFHLLKYLASSSGRVISREELLNKVWGYQNYPSTRTVDNRILRLRQKLEPDPTSPRFLITMYGAGYKFTRGDSASF